MEVAVKPSLALSPKVKLHLKLHTEYIVGGIEPVPGFFVEGLGTRLWDVDGKEYIDFEAGFSSVNQGHRHPYITQKVKEQYDKLALVNIAAHNPLYGEFAEMMCQRFGYDKLVTMVTGTEAADTACKTARKWGIKVKGIPAEKCMVLATGQSYHGMTSGVWNLQDKCLKRTEYGLDSDMHLNFNISTGESLVYGDLGPMERCLEEHHDRVAAVIMEVFHGTERSIEIERAYARGVYDLCQRYNVLFIADEVRQGAGKTGKFLSFQHLGDDCKPDIVTMGKSITGGMYPQSVIMGKEHVMKLIGTHETASTFAYTPIAMTAAFAAIEVIDRENLLERATELGERLSATINSWNIPLVDYFCSIGADANIFLKDASKVRRVAALCMHKGLLLFPRAARLRISLAMVMTDEELDRGLAIVKEALERVDDYNEIEGEFWHKP